MPDRLPMTPAEFDAAKREFEQGFPGLIHQTSGNRSTKHNELAGGHPQSKHLYNMAADYKLDSPNVLRHNEMLERARGLGFWVKPYQWGVHLQGLPTGPIPRWWWLKYGKGGAAEVLAMDHEAERVRADAG